MRGGKRKNQTGRPATGRTTKVWRLPNEYTNPLEDLEKLQQLKELLSYYQKAKKTTRDWTKLNQFLLEAEEILR